MPIVGITMSVVNGKNLDKINDDVDRIQDEIKKFEDEKDEEERLLQESQSKLIELKRQQGIAQKN